VAQSEGTVVDSQGVSQTVLGVKTVKGAGGGKGGGGAASSPVNKTRIFTSKSPGQEETPREGKENAVLNKLHQDDPKTPVALGRLLRGSKKGRKYGLNY